MRGLGLLTKGVVGAIVIIVAALVVSWIRTPGPAEAVPGAAADAPRSLDKMALAERLAGAIRFKTVSSIPPIEGVETEFEGLIAFLENQYPLAHTHLQLERINEHSLLYKWQGSDANLKPIGLLGHTDVVPATTGEDISAWEEPPYEGLIKDGMIWGRGALDDKVNVLGALEAVEYLLARGFSPKRTIYMAFGHDEEIGGYDGAAIMAALLQERGIEFEFVLDEGGALSGGHLMGLEDRIGIVGLAEKGGLTVELSVRNNGPSHSSTPSAATPIGVLSAAVARLEESQLKGRITPTIGAMLDAMAPHLPMVQRVVIANRWLFEPVLIKSFLTEPAKAAMMRTTTAPTMLSGSPKANMIPSIAKATINFRLLPGDSIEDVLDHVERTINDDRVEIKNLGGREASKESPAGSASYRLIVDTVHQTVGPTIMIPYLTVAGTDSRHYGVVTENVLRFTPMMLEPDGLSRIHGLNERISVENYANAVGFYINLIENVQGDIAP